MADILQGPNGLEFKAWCVRFTEGTSNKFWRAFLVERPDQNGARVATWWGRIGTAGSSQVKDFKGAFGWTEAHSWVESKLNEKAGGGYESEPAALADPETARKGEELLAISVTAPRTANLLEVCETRVETAVAALTSKRRGQPLAADDVAAVRNARAAMNELETRYHELQGLVETIDLLYSSKAS